MAITSEREENILSHNIKEIEENKDLENYEIPHKFDNLKEKDLNSKQEKKNEKDNDVNNKYLEDEDEDEYFRQCQNRRNKMEDQRNNDYINNMHNTISHSKFANKLRGTLNIKIYILNNNKPITFEVSYTDTIKDLKHKIYKQIENDSRFKLNFRSLDGTQ